MKQTLFSLLLALLPLAASADAVEIDGIYYNLFPTLKEAEVTHGNWDLHTSSGHDGRYEGKVVIPDVVEYDNTTYKVTTIGNQAFWLCPNLIEVILGSVNTIDVEAFGYCLGLTSIKFPTSLKSISRYAFERCSNLKSIYITDIEAWLNIEKNSDSIEPSYHLFLNNEEITDLSFPSTITSISSSAFANCIGITSVNIPNTITSIGAAAFRGCSNLKYISIPNSVNSIGNVAFHNCTNLTSVTIPNSVTSMGAQVFKGCTGLTSFTIPSSVTSISTSLFEGCKNLASVIIPSGIVEIGAGVFKDCISLNEIMIPSSVTTIGGKTSSSAGTFAGCTSLTSLTIPAGVTFIGNYIFDGCNKLTDLYCYAEKTPSTGKTIFSNYHIENATIHVPATAIDNYKTNEPWSGFKSIVAIEGDTPERPKCVKPIITYTDGKLKFTCETEGVTYVTDITDADIKRHFDATIMLTATYNISVYATKTGYEDSDIATATLCWIDSTPTMEGITNEVANVRATPVLIQNNGNVVSISGTLEGTGISIYDLSGKMVGSAEATSDVTNVYTSLRSGEVGIVKIGDKAIKVMMK